VKTYEEIMVIGEKIKSDLLAQLCELMICHCLALLILNWFLISLLLTVAIGLQKPCTKTEVCAGLVMYDVYLKTRNVDVKCSIKIPGYIFRIRIIVT
jgi:hypothetical protein